MKDRKLYTHQARQRLRNASRREAVWEATTPQICYNQIMDQEWRRFVNLAHQDLDKPELEPLPFPHILDILSLTMIGIFVIGLAKSL